MLVQSKFLSGPIMKGLYLWFIFVGPLISISSDNWVSIWVGLELNMISFLGLLCELGGGSKGRWGGFGLHWVALPYSSAGGSGGTSLPSHYCCPEGLSKYFLAQSVGTCIFLIFPVVGGCPLAGISVVFLVCGMMLKGGIAPLHQWFPSVCGNFSWSANLLLMTWQKVGPVFIISKVLSGWSVVVLGLGLLNLVFGVLGALSQSQFRQLLGYSSVAHMGWLISMGHFSEISFFLYFVSYIAVIVPTIVSMGLMGVYSFKDLSSKASSGLWLLLGLSVLFLSVAGMPPFLGFFLKAYSVYTMSYSGFMLMGFSFCLFAAMGLGYYLSLFFSFLLAGFSPANVGGVWLAGVLDFSSYGLLGSVLLLGGSFSVIGLPIVGSLVL